MKKLFALLLALVMVLGLFAGCKNQEPAPTDTPAVDEPVAPAVDENLDKALEYLKVFYKDTPEKVAMDFDRIGVVRIADQPYEIVWSVDVGEDLVKIVTKEDGSITVDINEEAMADKTEGIPFVLTATLTGTDGRQVTATWNLLLSPGIDPEAIAIVEAAYALADGETLDGTHTLTGKVISIDTPYAEDYKNITVTIEIKGAEDKPIKCYRLKGEGVEDLHVDDVITVTGKIKNYKGTIEFDAGCIMEACTPGPRVPVEVPTDPKQIVADAYALKNGGTLYQGAKVTLTGRVSKVDYSHKPGADNMSVTMIVEGKSFYCFYLTGTPDMLSQINVNDIITVNGPIKNYQGKIEFDHPQLTGLTNRAEPLGETDPAKIMADAAKLGDGQYLYLSSMTGIITQITSPYSSQYGNISFIMTVDGLEGQTVEAYRVSGKQAASLAVGDQVRVTGSIKNYKGTIEYVGTSDKGANPNPATVTLLKKGVGVPEVPGDGYTIDFSKLEKTEQYAETTVDLGEGYSLHIIDCHINTQLRIYDTPAGDYGPHDGIATFTAPAVIKTVKLTTGHNSKDGASLLVYASENGTDWTLVDTLATAPSGEYAVAMEEGTAYKYLKLDADGKQVQIATITFNGTIEEEQPPVPGTTPEVVEAPEAGVPYKWAVVQGNVDNKVLYFAGTTANKEYYFSTTENVEEAVDVTLETAEGGYYLSFINPDGAKKYINIIQSGTYVNLQMADAASTVYTYDTGKQTLKTNVDGTDYYIGAYNTFTTLSASKWEYIESSFPTHFYTEGAAAAPGVVDPVAGTAYKWAVVQGNVDNKTLYFAGTTANKEYYFSTTEDINEAVDVTLETAEGGYYLSFINPDGAKKYINIIQSGTYVNLQMADTAATVYTYDTGKQTLKTNVGGTDYYIGAYNTYTTLSASKWEYIETSFPTHFYGVGGGTTTPDPETPSTGDYVTAASQLSTTATYKLGLYSTAKEATYYFTGAMSGYYGATETDYAQAIDVQLETAEGGYYLTFNNGSKQYVNIVASGTHINFTFSDTASAVFTFDDTVDALCTVVDGTTYFMGTYSNYVTVGTFSADKAESSYAARLYTAEGGSTETPDPEQPIETLTVAQILAAGETGKQFYLEGTVGGPINTTWGNMDIIDETGEIYIYGLYNEDGTIRYDAMEVKPVEGDTIKILGTLTYYNGTAQIKNAQLISITPGEGGGTETPDPEPEEPASGYKLVTDASTLKAGDKIVITAKNENDPYVLSTWQQSNNRVGIPATISGDSISWTASADGYVAEELTLVTGTEEGTFGLQTMDGKYLYAAASNGNKLKTQDTLDVNASFAITGGADGTVSIVASKSSNRNIMRMNFTASTSKALFSCYSKADYNALSIYVIAGSGTTPDPEEPTMPAAGSTLTIKEALAAAQLLEDKADTGDDRYTVTGVITEISSTQYGNMYIQDEAGDKIYIYGLYNADGTVRYDAMTTQPAVGDTITVSAKLSKFNSVSQLKSAWLQQHTPVTKPDPDPETPPTGSLSEVAFADLKNGDQIIIVTSAPHTGKDYALLNTGDKGPAAVYTEGYTADMIWTVSIVDGKVYFTCAGGKLGVTDTNNGVVITEEGTAWTLDDSGYLASSGRFLGVYDNNSGKDITTDPNFRCYTNTTGNTKNQTTKLYLVAAGSGDGEDENGPTEPVNPEGGLASGLYLLKITASGGTVYYAGAFDGNEFSITTDKAKAVPYYISVNEGTVNIIDAMDGGILYGHSSGNYLGAMSAFGWTLTDNGDNTYSFHYTHDSDGERYVAFNANNNDPCIRCYKESSMNSNYVKAFTLEAFTGIYNGPETLSGDAMIAAAKALVPGENLPGTYTITGTITSIDDVDEKYTNRSGVMTVEGLGEVKLYRITGEGYDTLAVGDTIVVTGSIKNYKGDLQIGGSFELSASAALAKAAAPATGSVADALTGTVEEPVETPVETPVEPPVALLPEEETAA